MPDLHALDPVVLLAVTTALVLVQCALVVGFLVPAGKAAVLAGVLAGAGHLDPTLTYVCLASAAIVGAGCGYLIGRRHGDVVLDHRFLVRHRERIARARDLVHRRAGLSLLAGRSIAVLRATTPALAGAAGVGARRFMVFNVLGGLLWAAVFAGSGFLGARLVPDIGLDPAVAVLVGVAAVLVVVLLARPRSVEKQIEDPDAIDVRALDQVDQ